MIDDLKYLTWGEAGALIGAAIFLVCCLGFAAAFWLSVLT